MKRILKVLFICSFLIFLFSSKSQAVGFSIFGTVFFDTNGNGLKDINESPYPNAVIDVSSGQKTQTDSAGNYSVVNLSVGTYFVSQPVIPAQQQPSTSNPLIVIIASSDKVANFGLRTIPTPTQVLGDTTPPQISAVTVTNITQANATIKWTLNEPATGQIEYGLTTSYGNFTKIEQSYIYTTHVQSISNLSPNTTYHYRIKSSDQAGNQTISGDYICKTLGEVLTSTPTPTPTPTPTSTPTPTPTPIPTPVPCTLTSASWQILANPVNQEAAAILKATGSGACVGKQVDFKVFENDSVLEGLVDDPATIQPTSVVFDSSNTVTTNWTAEWQNDCDGWCNPPEYYFNASLNENSGNSIRSTDPMLNTNQAKDIIAPSVKNVAATNITATTANITWTLNEPATGQVQYGSTTAYGTFTALESSFNYTTHVQAMSGLTPSRTYHFRVISVDAAGNTTSSSDYSFVTLAAAVLTSTPVPPTPTPIPQSPNDFNITSGPTTANVTKTSADIKWNLSDYGTGQVKYGTTINYGLFSKLETTFDWNYHIQRLSNLTPGTTYHYRVISKNKTGKTIVSSDNIFKTIASLTPTSTPLPKKNCIKFWFLKMCL